MSTVYVVLWIAGGLSLSIVVMECGPPSFSRLNFFLATRMCVQSSVSADASVEKRRGAVNESVVVRMMAIKRQARRVGAARKLETPEVSQLISRSDKNQILKWSTLRFYQSKVVGVWKEQNLLPR